MAHVVQGHGFGRVLNQVGHIVHSVDQRVDLLAVDWRDEGLVQQLVDIMGDAVGCPFGVVHIAVVAFTQVQVVVIGHQLRKRTCRLDNAVRVVVEHLEEVAFAGH